MIVSISVLSCDMSSSSLLSDSERNSLYSVSIDADSVNALVDGAIIVPGSSLTATVIKRSGSDDPAALEMKLVDSAGRAKSVLRFSSPVAKALTIDAANSSITATKSVSSIAGRMAGMVVPTSFDAGIYTIKASLLSADGSILQEQDVSVFVCQSKPIIESVSSYPPVVEPGSSVLLNLNVSWTAMASASVLPDSSTSSSSSKDLDDLETSGEDSGTTTGASTTTTTTTTTTGTTTATTTKSAAKSIVSASRDPWIRWSKDGTVIAEGRLSAGMDKVVWATPLVDGAYTVDVEVFPCAPSGSSFSFKAQAKQDQRVMVIAPTGGSANDFSDSLSFFSLLRLDGSFEDSGTRAREAQPEAFGSPALDTYAGGFGYRFGSSSGVKIPGLMPPSSSGKLSAFSAVVRVDPSASEGSLVRFVSDDGSYAIILGLKDFKPYVETLVGGKVSRATAGSAVPDTAVTLQATLAPKGSELAIAWRIDGERVDSPSLALPPIPPSGSAVLGGSKSLPGVYDGFGLVSGSAAPTYRYAARRKWKASLILAESFEDSRLPSQSSASGGARAEEGTLALDASSSLTLSPAFPIDSGVVVEADIEGDTPSFALDFLGSDGKRALAILGSGEVLDSSGASLGSIGIDKGKLSITIKSSDGSALLSSSSGNVAARLPTTASAVKLALERGDPSREGVSLYISRVLARSAASKP